MYRDLHEVHPHEKQLHLYVYHCGISSCPINAMFVAQFKIDIEALDRVFVQYVDAVQFHSVTSVTFEI